MRSAWLAIGVLSRFGIAGQVPVDSGYGTVALSQKIFASPEPKSWPPTSL
jgi:hypothetical protein